MNIEKAHYPVLTIRDFPGLDPVTVVVQDLGAGRGRLLVECYGRTWGSYWGAMGNRSLREFVLDSDARYLADKLESNAMSMTARRRERSYLERIVAAVQKALSTIPYGEV